MLERTNEVSGDLERRSEATGDKARLWGSTMESRTFWAIGTVLLVIAIVGYVLSA